MGRAYRRILKHLTYGLARRLTIVLSTIILLCALAVLTISMFVQKRMIEDRLDLSTLHLASLITEVSIPALLKDDPAAVEFFFEELENRTDILSVAIVDRDGWLWMDGQNDQLDWLAPVTDPLLELTMETGAPQQELNQKILASRGADPRR